MKMNLKVTALIYSTQQPAEVTIVEMLGRNKYLAIYNGRRYAAMFNPFQGMYYVEDLRTCYPTMSDEDLDSMLSEMRSVSDSSERELGAYRKLGSVQHLRRLRAQEVRRAKNWKRLKHMVYSTVVASGVVLLIWIFVSGITNILA